MGYQFLHSPDLLTDPFLRIRPILKYLFSPYQDLETLLKANLLYNKELFTIKLEDAR